MSLLVHGSAVGAALALAGALPGAGGGRTFAFHITALEPEDTSEPTPEPLAREEVVVDETVELPPALDVTTEPPDLMSSIEPAPVLPTFEDPSAPFTGLPIDLDLRPRPRPVTPAPPTAPSVEVAEVAPLEPAPPSTPPAAELAPTEAAPGPDGAVVASSPTPLEGATPMPDYPASWARRGWVGEVTIELEIAPDGSVSTARVCVSSGFPRLDELARATLAEWRFAPAKANGSAVPSTFRQRIEFRAR